MNEQIIYVNKESKIPLIGVDFLGIIDRGTNIIELKPSTLCNLKCRYCFVRGGEFTTEFIIDKDYLIDALKKVIAIKSSCEIEIHFSPYGEILLYPDLLQLIESLWELKEIKRISLQSNGILLTNHLIDGLNERHVTRINISLNTLDEKIARYLCNSKAYDMNLLIKNVEYILTTDMDVLIAPVWFPGENDKDIEEIIRYIKKLRDEGYSEKKIQIGIQKYLIYSTGRTLKKVRPKSWGYFYHQLSELEKKHEIKLKLGPYDFDIKPCPSSYNAHFSKNELVDLIIVSKGRWNTECIGIMHTNPRQGMKIVLKQPFSFSPEMLGKRITARVIKANYKYNILTGCFPP